MKRPTQKTATTFGDWAYLAIAKHYRKMLKHEVGVLEDRDPEELHQMRVGMRRLRSAIAGFSGAIFLPQHSRDKDIARIARILGKLRDLDVLGDALENRYKPTLPKDEKQQLNKALKDLKKRRKKRFKRVESTLLDEEYCQLKEGFESWLNQPQYCEISSLSIFFVLPDLLLPQSSQLLLHPGWFVGTETEESEIKVMKALGKVEVESILETQGEALHDLRKVAKRSRYQMELFSHFYSKAYKDYLKEIKAIQTVLGEIQDSEVLAEFLNTTLALDVERKMPALAEQLRETRYQKWQAWQELQNKFLEPETRHNLRTAVQQSNLESSASNGFVKVEEKPAARQKRRSPRKTSARSRARKTS